MTLRNRFASGRMIRSDVVQSPTITWDGSVLVYNGHLDNPPQTLPASRHLLSVNATDLVRGSGVILDTNNYGFNLGTGPNDGCHYDGKFAFVPKNDGGNFGVTGGGSMADAIARDLYVGCALTPSAGQSISISGLDTGFQYSFGSHPLQVVMRYRVGAGDWHEVSSANYSVTPGYWLYSDLSLALNNEAALQNVQQPVDLRFYVYCNGNDARYHPAELVRSSGDDLIIRGTCKTVAVPGQPGGLRSVAGRHLVALSWVPVAGAESYIVRWGTTAGGPYTGSLTGLTQSLATITVEASTDLVTWTPLASSSLGNPMTALIAGVTVSSAGSAPATVTVFDAPAKATALHRFLWVRITRP